MSTKKISILTLFIFFSLTSNGQTGSLLSGKWKYADSSVVNRIDTISKVQVQQILEEKPELRQQLNSDAGKARLEFSKKASIDILKSTFFEFESNGKYISTTNGEAKNGTWELLENNTILSTKMNNKGSRKKILFLSKEKIILEEAITISNKTIEAISMVLTPVKNN